MKTKPTESLIEGWIEEFESDMLSSAYGDMCARYEFSTARHELEKALAEWREFAFPIIRQRVQDIFPDGKIPSDEGPKSVFIGWLFLISGFVKTETGLSICSPYDYNIRGLLCWNGFIRVGSGPLRLEVNHHAA